MFYPAIPLLGYALSQAIKYECGNKNTAADISNCSEGSGGRDDWRHAQRVSVVQSALKFLEFISPDGSLNFGR